MDSTTFSRIQRALAEPKRLEILEIIRNMNSCNGISCSHVLSQVEMAQSTFSHHISELVDAGIVLGAKEGRSMLLTVNEPILEEYLEELKSKILGKK